MPAHQLYAIIDRLNLILLSKLFSFKIEDSISSKIKELKTRYKFNIN